MKNKMIAYLVAGSMAVPALAGYGKDDTQIMFAFGGGANNARLYAEVLAQAERDRPGKPVAGLADRMAGHSAGAMLAAFLTLPHHSDGRPMSAEATLEHMGKHAPNILGTLASGAVPFFDKAGIQTGVRKHMASALGSNADLRVSDLPMQTDLIMSEVVEDAVLPATFSAVSAIIGEVPDATLAQVLTAAVAVERLAGQVPLAGAGQESKATRKFMDAGSRGKHDPTPELIQAAMKAGKPAHIFAFEGGFGFEQETLAWAEGTRKVEALSAKGLDLGDVDPKFGRVRVHLFHSSQPEHRACATCGNLEGKNQTLCKDHEPNVTRLAGRWVPTARMLSMFDQSENKLSVPTLALNLQSGTASTEINAELALIAHAQMIGPKGARTASYAKLLAVLAEADGSDAGSASTAASAAVEAKADGESKAARS